VHLELHTGDRDAAATFYARLFGWRAERIESLTGSYLSLDVGSAVGGGIVECGTPGALWLPYVGVADVRRATETARALGAAVMLDPREGPAGWRSVVSVPDGGEVALWQAKSAR